MKKVKKSKGFTLIEMIVVLIIIAILAAISLPAMVKYVDEARAKSMLSQGRTIYIAAQTIATKAITGDGQKPAKGTDLFGGGTGSTTGITMGANDAVLTDTYRTAVASYADMADGDVGKFVIVGDKTTGKVTAVKYMQDGDNRYVVIHADGTIVYFPALPTLPTP